MRNDGHMYIFIPGLRTKHVRDYEILQMHWDIEKLLSMGVDEKFLQQSDITPAQARDLVKGLLYLQERYKGQFP